MVDMDLLELLLGYVVLPVIVGLFAICSVFYYDYQKTNREQLKENRKAQVQGAQVAYEKIMTDAERLFAVMKYSAWNVAWRKMRPEGLFSEDLVEEDEMKWRQYDEALTQWRRHKIQYKTSVEVFFGKRDAASRLFILIDATFDKLSFELWFIYHENPSNPNVFLEFYVQEIGQQYDTIFNVIMTAVDKDVTREQEESVHRTTSEAFDELQDKINRMCFEMSECIRKENVGNMRRGRGLSRRRSSRL